MSDCPLCEMAKEPTETHTWIYADVIYVPKPGHGYGREKGKAWYCTTCGLVSREREAFVTCKRQLMLKALK